MTMANTIRGLLPDGTLPTAALDQVRGIVDELETPEPVVQGVPIFETLAEAEAWEAANPGKIALTLEGQEPTEPEDTPVTATAPSFDDEANTYTIPTVAGVRYLVNGSVVTGTVSVGDVDASVTVTAEALTGYTLVGTASWTHQFAATPVEPETDADAAPGTVLASDDFTGDGPLHGRLTVPALGGTAREWSAPGVDATTTGGQLVAGASTASAFLPVDRPDVEIAFTLVALPTAPFGGVCVRDSGTYRYELAFSTTNSMRVTRRGPGGGAPVNGTAFSLGPASVGKRFSLSIAGSTITVKGTNDGGTPVTLTGQDSDWDGVGGQVSVMSRGGLVIDDVVVTAR